MDKQIISKQRVANHGEVYTRPQEVNAMLDLVKFQSYRIESTFLEPACGTGNFLVEILQRKLTTVAKKYKRNQTNYECNALMALGSIYGIELLEDNIAICRQRLYEILETHYRGIYKRHAKPRFLQSVAYVLALNIVHGDALTMKRKHPNQYIPDAITDPKKREMARDNIIFPQWSFIDATRIKRHDYVFEQLVTRSQQKTLAHKSLAHLTQQAQLSLLDSPVVSGNQKAEISYSFFEYSPCHYLEIARVHPID